MDEKKVLYLTYDGITDPLGQSQILPYLKGLSAFGYRFTILSFEKKDRYHKQKDRINEMMREAGIEWVPLSFSTRPPLLAKFYDAVRMRKKAAKLQQKNHYHMVHCRSYIAADVGLHMKRIFGVKFFFDMRGFWADEKKDGGSWNTNRFVFRKVYHYYKKKEADYLRYADAIISLTHAGRRELMRWPAYNPQTDVKVIPCCADMELFSLTGKEQQQQAKQAIGVAAADLVLSYLGSVGTWYMLHEMLLFFQQLKRRYAHAKFLFISHSPAQEILGAAEGMGLQGADFIIRQATRHEVPFFMKASDINISFIKPVYSKISSSPTKLGEVLSMGIPVICNSGVGDVKEIVEQASAGVVIDGFTTSDFDAAIDKIPALLNIQPADIRNGVKDIFDLEKGIELYKQAYSEVL